MATLFFDTETSDKTRRGEGPGPRQPHIVQLAAVLVDEGTEGSMCALVRPDGWRVSPGAERVHGISTEQATAEGVPIREAIGLFHEMASRADTLVAHNIEFDRLVVLSEYKRLGMEHPFKGKREFCTMKAATDIVRLPGRYGYKWPTLQEAYRHFTGGEFDGAHDALADVRACRVIYEAIREPG
ncbi:hypothetical protein LCGC14_1469620 [marine sediment metagenome]|uniref:Exonuclease domain-containing protein n=1 Tax=marine sediment metagenome TaxID=412755 RepID=A0A0F9MEJ6_9ZZZZ